MKHLDLEDNTYGFGLMKPWMGTRMSDREGNGWMYLKISRGECGLDNRFI